MAEASGVVLTVYTHPACSGCTGVVQEAWRVTEAQPEVRLRTVSLTHEEGLGEAQAEGIRTIPTLILSAGSRELKRWVGTPEKGSLSAAVKAAAEA